MRDERDTGGGPGDDLAVERQFFHEYAAALESLASRYRLAADVLEHIGPSDRESLRAELRGVTRRTITATTITISLLDGGLNEPLKQTLEDP